MKTLSKTTEKFLCSFITNKDNRKFYTTEQGSKSYRNTNFQNFYNNNKECFAIIECGNDAARGGKIGNFVIVEILPLFFTKYNDAINRILEKENKAKAYQEKIETEKLKIGNQAELLKKYFLQNPNFLAKIITKINTSSSKEWRNWVKLQVCNKITNGRFDLLNISPAEIRDVAISI